MVTIDPSLSLAISVQSNPGVYALLLGSGVSRSSGVPTGWEVVEDLICKLAALKGENCDNDPAGWYKRVFSREPDYSEILNEIAKSPAERMQVLRSYFEPTEEERQEGRKLPSQAHHDIAKLVAKGYIRIVVTTNFDRLLETALSSEGIQPVIISTADAAKGALPLAHSSCTIIKVNGDYLDSRLKNTGEELACYEKPLNDLLDQVFDEYGLIVCGWSGDWDIGLRGALERCSTRRFTTYWASRGALSKKSQDLATLRRATLVPIVGADEFFAGLLDKVSALEGFTITDTLTAKVAVARMKKYLVDDRQRISLHDLLDSEVEKLYLLLTGPQFPVTVAQLSSEVVRTRMAEYEGVVDTVLRLMICGAHWGGEQHHAVLLRGFKRTADQRSHSTFMRVLADLARYPSLLLLYGAGMAAIASHNYSFLKKLFDLKVKHVSHEPERSVAAGLHHQSVFDWNQQQRVLGKCYTPLSDHLFEVLRAPLREYLPSDLEYDQTFSWFEYLFCLCHCDAELAGSKLKEKKAQDPKFTLWAAVGRFAWRRSYDGGIDIQAETKLKDNQPVPEKVAAVLKAGFFESTGQDSGRYCDVKAAFDRTVGKIRREWLIF